MSIQRIHDGYGESHRGRPRPRWSYFLNTFNPDNFEIAADVYPTGDGSDGFSIAFSIGQQWSADTGGGIVHLSKLVERGVYT